MRRPKSSAKATPDPKGTRPISDELLPLKQAAILLKCVERVGDCSDLGHDGEQLMEVISFTRRSIERVTEKLAAHFTAQGGAT
jgi:hypothetical protein